jgi:hypothetical protein
MTEVRKLYEIWCEGDPRLGYTACHLGYGKGTSLQEACDDWSSRHKYFYEHFDPHTMTYCGCKVHDNETDARELYN